MPIGTPKQKEAMEPKAVARPYEVPIGRDMTDNTADTANSQQREEPREDQADKFAALMQQVRQGSQEAAAEVWRQYGPYVVYVVRRSLHQSLRPHVDSQDFAQDVWASFFRVLPAANDLQTPEALFRFLTRVARNKVIDEHRRLHRQVRNVDRDVSHGVFTGDDARIDEREPTPSQLVSAEELLDGITAEGPPKLSRIVRMRREGFSDVEIAAQERISTRSIRRLIKDIKRLFLKKWEQPIE